MTGQTLQVRPRTLEILGPPGSGKSALLQALQTSRSDIVPVSIYWRKPENLSAGIRGALSIAPLFFERVSREMLSVQHLVWMIRLEAALPIFRRRMITAQGIATFDQGPVYTMARLRELRLGAEGSRLGLWWERRLDDWAPIIDLLIVLDAPDAVLIERIKGRSKFHVAKEQSEESASQLLMDDRLRYEDVADMLVRRRPMRVLRFDTSARSIDEIGRAVIEALGNIHVVEKRL